MSAKAWEKYFPNSIKEAYKDYFQTLFFNGSLESRVPMIMYGVSVIWSVGYEEERVEEDILLSSYLGYPVFRIYIPYPANTDRGERTHGDIYILLNKEDENLLYKRSKDELFIEKTNTYSLPFLWTRKNAILKDQEEKGKIEKMCILIPSYTPLPEKYGIMQYYIFPIN